MEDRKSLLKRLRTAFDSDRFLEIWETITRNKSRSLLTGFGVFWGIFMLLSLLGGGDGLKALLESNFEGFATNSGILFPGTTSRPYMGYKSGRSWSLSTKDLEKVRAKVPDAAVVTGALAIWGGSAQYEGRTTSCAGNGVLPDYAKVQDPKLKYGRYINDVDVRQERKVCVIGHRIYENLFPEGGDPCGKFIEMAGTYFQVVGMDTNDGGINLNGSSSEMVVVPISVIQKIYGRGDSIDFMCFVAKEGVKIKDILERAGEVLCREHYIDPSDKKAMGSINLEEMFSIMDSLFKGVNILIWLVGFGTLLAASIGVSNIMMVTVKERTTEIGIRRAIGATPRMILSQIMMESVILTLIFGLFGIVVSVFLLTGAEYIVAMTGSHVAFQISFSSAMLALLIILVLGVLAGLAPASRAMSIRPVDAMRDE